MARPFSITTKEQAERALVSFCEHIAAGKPQYSWYLDEPLVRCVDVTLLQTMKDRPELFDTSLKEVAHRKAYEIWWQKGQNMVEGKVKGSYSPQIYNTMMRNLFRRFGWWDEETESKEKFSTQDAYKAVKALASAMTNTSSPDLSKDKEHREDQSSSAIDAPAP